MNNTRRKSIEDIKAKIGSLMSQLTEEIKSQLEDIRDEEQDYFDNMPESFQIGERGALAQSAIDNLESAISDIDLLDAQSVVDSLDAAING